MAASNFSSFVLNRDIFGQPITVMWHGSDVHKTKMGTLCTFLTYGLLLAYLVTQINSILDGNKQNESTQTKQYDRYSAGRYSLAENYFNLTIAVLKPIPERVGRFVVLHEVFDESGKDKTQEIPLVLCSKDKTDEDRAYWSERSGEKG